jgi:LmbE family N-acetylglucosaminyl deacetylase
VLALNLSSSGHPLDVLCIGAHCDDIEIGCGGTVITLQHRYPDCRIHWLVLTSGAGRRKEALRSANAFVEPDRRGETWICDLPDGLLPAHFAEVKAQFERVKKAVSPDLIFTHHRGDLHQDHRLLSQVTWQTFRDHLIWEYEIPKYDGDLVTTNIYMPLSPAIAARKTRLIMKLFASQSTKSWFRPENLEALMRLRGLESRATTGLAEGFHGHKMALEPMPARSGKSAGRRKR